MRDLGEYNRDLFATESIEVLEGLSALMFGRGSTGGLINQVSKVADRLERKEVAVIGRVVRSETGHGRPEPSDQRESSAFRIIGLGEDSGSYRFPQDVNKLGFAPSFWLNVGRDHRYHAVLLLPEDERRDRLWPADDVQRNDRVLRVSAGLATDLLRLGGL